MNVLHGAIVAINEVIEVAKKSCVVVVIDDVVVETVVIVVVVIDIAVVDVVVVETVVIDVVVIEVVFIVIGVVIIVDCREVFLQLFNENERFVVVVVVQ